MSRCTLLLSLPQNGRRLRLLLARVQGGSLRLREVAWEGAQLLA